MWFELIPRSGIAGWQGMPVLQTDNHTSSRVLSSASVSVVVGFTSSPGRGVFIAPHLTSMERYCILLTVFIPFEKEGDFIYMMNVNKVPHRV